MNNKTQISMRRLARLSTELYRPPGAVFYLP